MAYNKCGQCDPFSREKTIKGDNLKGNPGWYPQNLTLEIQYDPAIPLLAVHLRELKTYIHTKTSIQISKQYYSKSPKSQNTQMPINWYTNKQNMVYLNNRILFCHEKEWSTAIPYNMHEPGKY